MAPINFRTKLKTFILFPTFLILFGILILFIIATVAIPNGKQLATKLYKLFGWMGLKMVGINESNFKQVRDSKHFYHPGKSGAIYIKEKKLAYFAEIHPNILREFEINTAVVAFEKNINFLMDLLKEKKISKSKFQHSSFQSSIRDFSFEIKKNVLSSDIISFIKKIDKQLIKDVFIFDNYVGKISNKTIRSVSVEVKIQSDTETLSETSIQNLSNNIVDGVEKKFEAKQR